MSNFIQVVDRQGRILALMDRREFSGIGRSPTYEIVVGPTVLDCWGDMQGSSDQWFANRVAFQIKSSPIYQGGKLLERLEWLIPLCKLPKEFYKLPGVIDARNMFKS